MACSGHEFNLTVFFFVKVSLYPKIDHFFPKIVFQIDFTVIFLEEKSSVEEIDSM